MTVPALSAFFYIIQKVLFDEIQVCLSKFIEIFRLLASATLCLATHGFNQRSWVVDGLDARGASRTRWFSPLPALPTRNGAVALAP